MKKIFTLLVALMATTALWAYDFEVNGIYYNILTDKTNEVEVTYQGDDYYSYSNEYYGSVTIPSSVTYNGTTYSVTSIGYDAFAYCYGLTSITIPKSVTSIGSDAFDYCSGLTSVVWNAKNCADFSYSSSPFCDLSSQITSFTFGDSVQHIPAYLCLGMSKLTSITIPNSVTSIGDYAFGWCSGLTSITIPNSVTSIGDEAFSGCSSLTSITIPNSVTSIGYGAFEDCSGLVYPVYNAHCFAYMPTSYKGAYIIPEGIKQIAGGAFQSCTSLTSITIPNSVTSIGNGAFRYCSGLTSVTIPNSVTSIGDGAFSGCTGLTSITIPNSVTSIGSSAFSYCYALTSITIPNSVTSIGYDAFRDCSGLTYLSIPSSVVYYYEETDEETGEKYWWYDNGFSSILGCYNLKTLIAPASFFGLERNSENEYQYAKEEYFPYLPEKLETLVLNAEELPRFGWDFIERNRKALKTIDLGAITETSIPEEIFRNYFSLETLVLPSQLEYIPYLSIAECMKLQAITIPATVTEIADRAFEDCRSLKSIIFEGEKTPQGAPRRAAASGSSLWRIGSWAFYNCHQLEHLTIPEGVTEVGDAAFYGCAYLQDMTLPSTVQEIGDNGFALCAKLQKIHVKATTPPAIKAKTFFDVNRQIPVYVPNEVVAAYESDPYWSEFDIQGESKAPAGVEDITTSTANTQKIIRNGQLIIIRDGVEYNTLGQAL